MLAAGERCSYNANTIVRQEDWRKKDRDGALRIHPDDATASGVEDGGWAFCESARGRVQVRVEVSDEALPGVASLPHGFGMRKVGDAPTETAGPAINELTSADHCDALAKTPFHKHIPVRVVPAEAPAA